LHGGDGFFDRTVGGQQQHGDGGIGLLGLAQNVQARSARHLQIGDDQEIAASAHFLNGRGTVRRFVDGVSGALQRLAQHGAQFLLVFNEEERFHLFRFYHESYWRLGTTRGRCAEKGSSSVGAATREHTTTGR